MKFVAWIEGLGSDGILDIDREFFLCVHCSTKEEEEVAVSNDNVNSQLDQFLDLEIEISGPNVKSIPRRIRVRDCLQGGDEAEFQFEVQAQKPGEASIELRLLAECEEVYLKKIPFRAVTRRPKLRPVPTPAVT